MENSYEKTGYLDADFRIFYLIDKKKKEFNFHYHDFYKVLIFLNGNASYIVEGRQYDLQPGDVILVNAGEIHKAVIHDNAPYERIIIYVSSRFFENYKNKDYDLFQCFLESQKQHSNLVRVPTSQSGRLKSTANHLANSFQSKEYANELYQKVTFIQYLILLNRIILEENLNYTEAITANKSVLRIMEYINDHLTEDLSIDVIAKEMYLNRSYMMHLFKAETGYPIGKYITEKRLFIARQYISEGQPVTQACYQSGFKNYATFYHAYTKKYNASPKTSTDRVQKTKL